MRRRTRYLNRGFTLLELMITIVITSAVILIMTSLLDVSMNTLNRTRELTQQFRSSRMAFEYLSRNLQQATLNTYWDYDYSDPESPVPDGYTPQSDLHFLVTPAADILDDLPDKSFQSHAVFFQAPLGASNRYTNLSNLLNARGYFVEFGDDEAYRPDFIGSKIAPRYRFRLKEFRPPGEENYIFKEALEADESETLPVLEEWFVPNSKLFNKRPPYHQLVRNVADNVIALIVSPQISEKDTADWGLESPAGFAPQFAYDSRFDFPAGVEDRKRKTLHQLPPLLKLIVVTISEKSAIRLQDNYKAEVPPELKIPAELFRESKKLDEDLEAFEARLQSARIDYRVFQTTLGLRASKWSDEN